jgi:hypothetical protein
VRIFAALYSVFALAAVFLGKSHHDLKWVWFGVCLSAAAIALVAAVRKHPMLLLAGAHAGLTATWAGTLAAREYKGRIASDLVSASDYGSVSALVMLCAGMAIIIATGLKSAQREAARTSQRR